MHLKLIIDDQEYTLDVPGTLVEQAEDFFAKMDLDMNRGWQMGREWVDDLDKLQRCQVVADKLLTAMETENHDLGRLMGGYIMSRAPDSRGVGPCRPSPVTIGTIHPQVLPDLNAKGTG